MTNKYGLTTAANAAKPARATVARWNDGRKRHTVFTVCGTTQDGWGLWNDPLTNLAAVRAARLALAKIITGNTSLTDADLPSDGGYVPAWASSPDTYVGRQADPDLFNWVPISYPASAPGSTPLSLENNWQPSAWSMAQSARAGIDELIRQIKATPGTFALVGMSQGALVISQVLKALLPGGALANRYDDCIAGIAFGNPCRAPGASFPGGVAAPGGGVIALPNRANPLTGGLAGVPTPDWWWEMCVPGDFFSSAPVDVLGTVLTPAIQALFHTPGSLGFNADGLQVMMTLMVGGGTIIGLLVAALIRGGLFTIAEQLNAAFTRPEMKAFFSTVAQKQKESPVAQMAQWIYQQVGVLDIPASIQQMRPIIVPSNYYRANPHSLLGVEKPPALPSGRLAGSGSIPGWTISLPGVTSDSTYIDIAVAYLNARGAAIAPR